MFRNPKAYAVADILPHIRRPTKSDPKPVLDLDGDEVKVYSLRLRTFKEKGLRCVTCGVEGTHFYKERATQDVRWHINLWGVTPDGVEVMLTKDHIQPRAKGGRDRMDNMQPMCRPCNIAKRDRWDPKTS